MQDPADMTSRNRDLIYMVLKILPFASDIPPVDRLSYGDTVYRRFESFIIPSGTGEHTICQRTIMRFVDRIFRVINISSGEDKCQLFVRTEMRLSGPRLFFRDWW